MYEGDSFFTLSVGGRIGLTILSTLLAVALIAVCQIVRRRTNSTFIGVFVSLTMFWLFVWLSPQIYYSYYRLIFDDLPAQMVIKLPPRPERIVNLLTFQVRLTLSGHSAGVLGWLLHFTGAIDLRWRR